MTFSEQVHNFLRLAAAETVSRGSFKEIVRTPDGLQLTHQVSLATGMAWQAKRSSYSQRFGKPPDWLEILHPTHRISLCNLAISVGHLLPVNIDDVWLATYLANIHSFRAEPQSPIFQDAKADCADQPASINCNAEPITEFEVDESGTITMADFSEPKIRSEFYESAYTGWSESPADLAIAMRDCQPLAWTMHSIYTKVRDDIQSDLDSISSSSRMYKKRAAALKVRIQAMPEEPEQGVLEWLLALTSNEFKIIVVPDIEEWFRSPPNWNWEDDHFPMNATAQGAALEFFQNMDGDALDIVGVTIVEGNHPGSTYYAAELTGNIEEANKAASEAGMPMRFRASKE